METPGHNLFPAFLLVWASIIMFIISFASALLLPDLAVALNLRVFIVPSAALGVMLTVTTRRKDLYENEKRRWLFCLIAGMAMIVLPVFVLFVFN